MRGEGIRSFFSFLFQQFLHTFAVERSIITDVRTGDKIPLKKIQRTYFLLQGWFADIDKDNDKTLTYDEFVNDVCKEPRRYMPINLLKVHLNSSVRLCP